jgi:hypothetical protein
LGRRGGGEPRQPRGRRLRLEPLEQRTLLSFTWYGSVLTVDGKRPSEFRDADGKHTLPIGNTVMLGEPGLTDRAQAQYVAYARLEPAESYEVTVKYDLHTWGAYLPPYGKPYRNKDGDWVIDRSEAFSVSVMDQAPTKDALGHWTREYEQLLEHPLNFPGLGFVWGGSIAEDRKVKAETTTGTTTLVFPGSSTAPKWLVLAHTIGEGQNLPPAARAPAWGGGVSGSGATIHGGGSAGSFGGAPMLQPPDWGTFTISLRDVEAKDLVRKPDGGATFAYALSSDKIPTFPINFYWAKSEKK